MYQHLSKVGVDAPVASLVGVGQCRSCDVAANTHVIQLRRHCTQTCLDIPQTFAITQLGKCHAQKLIHAGKTLHLVLSFVSGDAFAEILERQKIHNLSKNRPSGIHRPFPSGQMGQSLTPSSNRLHSFLLVSQSYSICYNESFFKQLDSSALISFLLPTRTNNPPMFTKSNIIEFLVL